MPANANGSANEQRPTATSEMTQREKLNMRLDYLLNHTKPDTAITITIVVGAGGQPSKWLVNQIANMEGQYDHNYMP